MKLYYTNLQVLGALFDAYDDTDHAKVIQLHAREVFPEVALKSGIRI